MISKPVRHCGVQRHIVAMDLDETIECSKRLVDVVSDDGPHERD